ncbi:MAG: OmpA family protein [Bacteroidota bacterium]
MIRILQFVLLPLLLLSFTINAQDVSQDDEPEPISPLSKSNFNSWAISFGVGNIITSGDLKTYGASKSSFDLGYHLYVAKMFNASLGLEFQGIMGTSNTYPDKFKENILELNGESSTPFITGNMNLVINLSNLIFSGNNYQRKWNFAVYPGFGITYHKAYFTSYEDPIYNVDWANNGEKTDTYTRVFSIPLGMSLKYRLSKNFDLELRETFTHYNDDNFDGQVYGTSQFDWSYYTSLSLVWKIGKKERALDWTDPLDENLSRIDVLESKVDGISTDTDNDGVADMFDVDNETPEGIMVAGNGRALDADRDGIPDYKDIEPFTAVGVDTDQYGKEIDSDNDGVGNSRDIEPDSEEGAFVNWQGKTIRGGSLVEALIPSVYFKLNSSSVDYRMHKDLVVIAKLLFADPELNLDVVGYTDQSGPDEYNRKLGIRRAEAVVKHLVDVYGVDKSKFEVKSLGEDRPLTKKDTYYSINRRVDFKVKR